MTPPNLGSVCVYRRADGPTPCRWPECTCDQENDRLDSLLHDRHSPGEFAATAAAVVVFVCFLFFLADFFTTPRFVQQAPPFEKSQCRAPGLPAIGKC